MNKLIQFLFKPQGKDRLWWAWINAAFSLFFFTMIFLICRGAGRWTWVCSGDAFFFFSNLVLCWFNSTMYDEWKEKQPPA